MPGLATEIVRKSIVKAHNAPGVTDVKQIRNGIIEGRDALMSIGSEVASAATAEFSLHEEAIELVLVGLTAAATAVIYERNKARDETKELIKEIATHACSFTEHTSVEIGSLALEQRVMRNFFDLNSKPANQQIENFLGIDCENIEDIKYHTVIPYYRADDIELHVESESSLDLERATISLFFSSALARAFAAVKAKFDNRIIVASTVVSTFKGSNYLNNVRAPRFIMQSIGNLLWNLQDSRDPLTGISLDLDSCIELCRVANNYLGELLECGIRGLDYGELISLVTKAKEHVIDLQAAYEDRKVHEIRLKDLSNSLRRSLRITVQSLFTVTYEQHNLQTKSVEGNPSAAQDMMYLILYLNELLINDPTLIDRFYPYAQKMDGMPIINKSPTTIIDILAILCHLSFTEREQLFGNINPKLKKGKHAQGKEFAQTLIDFHDKFIDPLRNIPPKSNDLKARGDLAVKRLLPMLSLLIAERRFNLDKPLSNQSTQEVLQVSEQVAGINALAVLDKQAYEWQVEAVFGVDAGIASELGKLIKDQYRLLRITDLFDRIEVLAKREVQLWQSHDFQQFMQGFIARVQQIIEAIQNQMGRVDKAIGLDRKSATHKQVTLSRMLSDMTKAQNQFLESRKAFMRIIGNNNFDQEQQLHLSQKITFIAKEYQEIFNHDSGLSGLIELVNTKLNLTDNIASNSASAINQDNPPPPPPVIFGCNQLRVLRNLVQDCYNTMSYYSRYLGRKETLMKNLLNLIDTQAEFTEAQLNHTLLELFRICSSFSETNFFQVSYAKTRSAHRLISMIKDPAYYEILPIGNLLFGQNIRLDTFEDGEIFNRLVGLKDENHWEESARHVPQLTVL